MIAILLFISLITIILYYFAIKPNNYWKERNVQTGKTIPIVGDNLQMILGRENVVDMIKKMYNKLPDVRYLGVMQFQVPTLIIKCPELLKKICVKDFDHFLNHRNFIQGTDDELWSKNLLVLKGQTWKHMRSTLSPSFTSSKMKSMFVLICNNANLFAQYFLKKNDEIIEIEFKDACTRYTNDVIASVAFGIQVDSLNDRDNEFYTMGKEAMNFASAWRKMVFLLYQFCPNIASFLKIKIFGDAVKEFFMNLVEDTIRIREEQNIKRSDMLGLLLEARNERKEMAETKTEEAKKNVETKVEEASFAVVEEHLKVDESKRELTDSDIASQVFIFFLGGFETVSTAMCFMAHELASNPDYQKKLIQEIDENRPANGAPSYETIAKMTYLDMVVSETLRKWPVNIATDRVVTKPYTIEPELPDEKPVHLEVGMNLMIPIIGIHYDPKYYENPDKFDPERFSPENRNTIDPYTYIPFGVGPRNCIGSRFALLEMKAIFFYLLSHFEIVPVADTQIPIKLSRNAITLLPENGFPLGLKKRHKY